MLNEEETFELEAACPFCGREGLTYTVEVIQWTQNCPGCGAIYWYDEEGEFFDNIGSLLDECNAEVIQQCIAKLESEGKLHRVVVEPHEFRSLAIEVVFVQLPTLPEPERVTLSSTILSS